MSIWLHALLFVITASWLVWKASSHDWSSGTDLALAASSSWLVAGPALVVKWERKRSQLLQELEDDGDFNDDSTAEVRARTQRYRWLATVLIPIPIVLILGAYVSGDDFLRTNVHMPDSGVSWWVGAVVLATGGLAAGYGAAGAARTIVLSVSLAHLRGKFTPYAGVASRVGHCVAEFCFSSALIFGLGGSVLLPGVTASIVHTTGTARVWLVLVIVMIIGGTVALLAAPATFLSRRYAEERDTYLRQLSEEIDKLAARASDPSSDFTDNEYLRLRSLLELRSHVVQHAIAQPSVEMVKRIPLAVLVPVGSTAAAWLAVWVH